MENIKDRKRKSVQMTKEEHRAFVQFVSQFPTKIDAAYAFGFSRITLDAVLLKGSGRPDTIQAIREKLLEKVRA